MNDWQAKRAREAALQQDVLALHKAQQDVIGSLVRRQDELEREIVILKQKLKTSASVTRLAPWWSLRRWVNS